MSIARIDNLIGVGKFEEAKAELEMDLVQLRNDRAALAKRMSALDDEVSRVTAVIRAVSELLRSLQVARSNEDQS